VLIVEAKLKHLEMLQAVINRMASNSFVFKGWAVTIIAGLSAFAAKDADKKLLLVALFATLLFWAVDAFYLSLERRYRELYAKVAKKDVEAIDLSMTLPSYRKYGCWAIALFSPILLTFYGVTSLLIIGTVILIKIG
jgi:hypothetical protein